MTRSIVIGATGLVGKNVLDQLTTSGVRAIAVVRRPLEGVAANVEVLEVDFDDFLMNGTLPQCDHLFICLGTTIKKAGSQAAFKKIDFDYGLGFAQKARAAGASGVSLVSSVGADSKSKNFYLRTKGQLEEAIQQLGFSSINIYRPGLLVGVREEKRTAEKLGQTLVKFVDPLLVGSLSRYRSISAGLLAKTMVDRVAGGTGVRTFHFRDFNFD
jgi:uncharacterized protein YbjT (DUF2867 family)